MNDQQISDAVARVLSSFGGASAAPVVAAPVKNETVANKAPAEDLVSSLVSQILGEKKAVSPAGSPEFVPSPSKCGWERAENSAVSDDNMVSDVIAKVLAEKNGSVPKAQVMGASCTARGDVCIDVSDTEAVELGDGVFASMDEAVAAAAIAQKQYLFCSMEERQAFIDGIRDVILQPETLERLSRMGAEQTGMGKYEHKIIKNRLAAEKTPGTEDLTTEACSGDGGLTLVEYSAYGVIGSITPTTNPTETIICNSIGMLAAGNSVVYSPHPRARVVSLLTIKLINRKLATLGAPANLITTVQEPSIDNTNAMMNHPKIRMLVATGGPGIVKTVMSTGKKAIGAGAGNPPVVVDETADIEKAAVDIINGCSFDNNLPCIAEKEIIAVNQIADYLISCMTKCGAYLVEDPAVIKKLEALVINEKGGPQTSCVGKSAVYLLDKVGIKVGEDIKVILIDLPSDHVFVQEELMMPILPLVRVPDVDEAIDLAVEVEHGNRHTAMMHSTNVRKLTKMAKLIQTTIFVKNGPSYAGIGVGGEGYTTFTIAGPTGEGLTGPKAFARKRRCVMVESLNVR
ncbi:aldehyde dehydrogenase family protein [uncultured Cohaesibacter sp.]|uniref:aldehyde dehydrogenase family protein n=1 Tax=uncultured Cohaesibacter sp. TaxID=1002546 RepID=UPI0029C62593|nr:aldehyde dehydrogenase family protein [uncultured Cohaesibacter sp.]